MFKAITPFDPLTKRILFLTNKLTSEGIKILVLRIFFIFNLNNKEQHLQFYALNINDLLINLLLSK